MYQEKCFIRKNTRELREYLKELGYKICLCAEWKDSCWLTVDPKYGVHGEGYYDEGLPFMDTQERSLEHFLETTDMIDCGESEEAFKAIAAIRDDSDINQLFVLECNLGSINTDSYVPKGSLMKCLREKWNTDGDEFSSRDIPAHKASPKEIIKKYDSNN